MTLITREVPPGSGRFRVVTEPASGPRQWQEEGDIRWDETHPRQAPQFRCHVCRKWIALTRSVILLSKDNPGSAPVILCLRCIDRPTPRQAHARWYPDCPERWHDMFDHHDHALGSRAGIAAHLGIWPRHKGAV